MFIRDKIYIDGEWRKPTVEKNFELINPATEQIHGSIAMGAVEDANRAVAAAKSSFDTWRHSTKDERLGLLERLYELYLSRKEEVAEAVSLEMGCPIDLCIEWQAQFGDINLNTYIKALRDFEFHQQLPGDWSHNAVVYEPAGVAALITPWNWPVNQITLKVGGALAAGCTMVLKPSEFAPLSAALLTEMIDEVGYPAGVFNMLYGEGHSVGDALTKHPDVNVVSLTGSTRAGLAVQSNAAQTLKKTCLELGGKGAYIVFDDADPGAAEHCVGRLLWNSGQTCSAPTRLLVQRDVYDEVVERAKRIAEAVTYDLPSKPGDHIGPVTNLAQFEKIQSYIEIGINEGATLVAGGPGRPEGRESGYFVKPTIFADVSRDMRIANEEIFGPVLSVIPFDTEEEAIEIANSSEYGLTNYIQSADKERARRVAGELTSGMVELNGQYRAPGAPFGGRKSSGIGREAGVWGMKEFLELKSVAGWFN